MSTTPQDIKPIRPNNPIAVTRGRQRASLVGPGEPNFTYPALTQREIAVLRLLALGFSNAQAAVNLNGITEDTVKTHVRRIFISLGASDRAHAVALGFRYGFLNVDMLWPTDAVNMQPIVPVTPITRSSLSRREARR